MNHYAIPSIFRQKLSEFAISLNDPHAERISPRELSLAFMQVEHYGQQVLDYVSKLQALLSTAALLTSALDADTVLERVLDTVIDIVGAERAYVLLREGPEAELAIAAARQWDHATVDEADALFSTNIVDYVVRRREPVIALNAQGDPRFGHFSSVQSKSLRSLLCMPLIQCDEIIGVLYADNRVTRGVFQESLLPLMEAFAHHVVVVLENARRFQQTAADLNESRQQVRWLQLQAANQKLPDPLTDRELEVLMMIASGLSNQEIADALMVEISTVKKHINSLYSKIDADSRGKAIARAQELKLV